MSEKKKTSPLCLTGFILSLLSPVITLGGLFLFFLHGSVRFFGNHHNRFAFINCIVVLGIALMIAGLILSIAGIRTLKTGYGGKKPGVIGIVISILMIIFWLAIGAMLVHENMNPESPPTSSAFNYEDGYS